MGASFSPPPLPPSAQAVPLYVALYDRSESDPSQAYTLLPNIWCDRIERKDGAEPSAASFHYILDNSNPQSPFPSSFSQFWPITASANYVVQPDDELCVFGVTSSGAYRILFDGFVTNPQTSVSGAGQSGSFTAAGVEIRLWDIPIGGPLQRGADAPNTAGGEVLLEGLRTRFNPNVDGHPTENCTPDGKDVNQPPDPPDPSQTYENYPAFIQSDLIQADAPDTTLWTLAKLARYLMYAPIFRARKTDQAKSANDLGPDSGGNWVTMPSTATLDTLLESLEPKNDQTLDANDPSTYDAKDIIVRDVDVTGMALPEALGNLLEYYDFGMRFDLGQDSSGNPSTRLIINRKDPLGAAAPKQLNLQALGATLDPSKSNAGQLHLARDHTALYNSVSVISRAVAREVGVLLSPLFSIDPADADKAMAADSPWLRNALADADNETRRKYRWYGADEAGDGHWDFGQSKLITGRPIDFSELWPKDSNGKPTYVARYRPGRMTLVSRDNAGKRRRAKLFISRDYTGVIFPDLYSGGGTWMAVSSGWRLLKDQLGIELICDNPEAWKIGSPTGTGGQNASQVVRGITSLAKPSNDPTDLNSSRFYLLLVTVIDGDEIIDATAEKRKASPTKFTVLRRLDAADHYRKEIVDKSSYFYDDKEDDTAQNEEDDQADDDEGTDGDPQKPRDDTAAAKAMAAASRAAHELPRLAGTITIPALSNAYNVGDRLNLIGGVNVSFKCNAATEAGESPIYPVVVGRTWEFTGEGQTTQLMITDRRAEPQRPS